MKTHIALLTAAAFFTMGDAAMAAEKTTYESKTKVESDSKGNYNEESKIKKTNAAGSTTHKEKVNVDVHSNGDVDNTAQTENISDPKGLMNKHSTKIIERVISVMSVVAQEKNILLNVHYEAGLFKTFIGDAGRIRQILLNLVGNAIKFTDVGSVSVSLANGGKGNGKRHIRISVTDTGIGIAPDKMEHVFEKFIQADSSITRRYGGTGLGLAISKSLAEQMGGSITVTSTEGVGSTFVLHLSLPVQASESIKSSDEENFIYLDKRANTRSLPILLVEDYEPNILVATNLLENFGYRYEVAHNGQEALERFMPDKYSMILMDVQMPFMDGLETTSRIRASEATHALAAHVPIIAMTAHALKGDRERCLQAGMDDYITKPFNPHQLQAVLVKHLKG